MFKVNVKKNNVLTNSAKFATQELAQAWFSEQESLNSFGKKNRLVAEDQLELEGEDVSQATEFFIETVMGTEIKFYRFNAEYTKEIVDTAAEDLAAKKLSDRSKKRAFGEALIDKISTMNDAKSLTVEQVDAFMSNTLISSLREHLWAGNIDTFITKLGASDVSAFFTSQEKTAVIAECQTFLTSLGG